MTQFHGPFDPEISPDGSKIAFEYFNDTYDAEPGCNELTVPPCFVYTQSQGVGITNSTGFTGVDAYGILTGWIAPHWMSNDVLLRSSPGANLNDDAVFTRVGETTNDHWFYDPNQGLGVEDVELSRDLQTVVGIAGFYDEKLRVYRTTMSPFGARTGTTRRSRTTRTSRSRSSATSCRESSRAPRSPRAARRWPTARPRASSSPRSRTTAPPATRARWSSRAPSTPIGARPTSRPPPRSRAAPASSTQPAKPGAAAGKLTLSVSRNGKVKVTVPGAGKVKVTAKRKRRTIATASRTVKAAGTVTFKLKARGRVTVTATFAKQSARRTVTLRG